jgi:hypothetical protein
VTGTARNRLVQEEDKVMTRFRTLLTIGTGMLLIFATGIGCTPSDSPPDTTGDGSGNGEDTDTGPTITVQFVISARVLTSIGSGVDGETVNFQADKFHWNDYEEGWEFRRTASASRTTSSVGEPGTTDTWLFGYDLHQDESVFISATEQASGQKKEITYSYTQATAAAVACV